MYYSGIDQDKKFSYTATVNEDGVIIKRGEVKNNDYDLKNYFYQYLPLLTTASSLAPYIFLTDASLKAIPVPYLHRADNLKLILSDGCDYLRQEAEAY